MCSATKVTPFFHGFFHGSSPQGGGTSATVFSFDCLANGELHEAKREGSGDKYPPFKDVSHVNNGTKVPTSTSTGELIPESVG